MLISEGPARSPAVDRRLACLMALVAGALNAAGFDAVGVFSANMTGNVSTLADHVALGELLAGSFSLAVVGSFVLGAALSSFVTSAGKRRGLGGIYALAVLAEAGLLALLGGAELCLPAAARAPVLVFGLSFLMGLQNAVVTRISDARVRTTHVSGMATDVGIGLGCLAELALRGEPAEAARPHRDRLKLHGATILSFCLGGVLGVFAFRAVGALLLFAAAALLAAAALPALLRTRPRPGVAPGP